MPRKLKSSRIQTAEPLQLAVKQALSCTMSLNSVSTSTTSPSLHFPLIRYFLYNRILGPASVCLQTEPRFQTEENKYISLKQPRCSCKHLHTVQRKQVMLQVFRKHQYTRCLKPLITSVSSSFHVRFLGTDSPGIRHSSLYDFNLNQR